MNFLQLARRVKKESGGLSGGGPAAFATATGADSLLFDWVNWAWRDIDLSREAWSWRQGAAQATTTAIAIPTGAGGFDIGDFATWRQATREYRPTAYRASDGPQATRQLHFIGYDRFRLMFQTGVHQPGAVQYWSTTPAGDFLIGPTPDAAHIVRADYIRTNTPMAADGAVPAMPERFHDSIVWYALREYAGFDAASEVWQRANKNYDSIWYSMARDCLPRMQFGSRPLK
jgi:hypothetical protein